VGLFDVVGPGPVDCGLPSVVSGFGGDRRGLIESAVVSLGGVGPQIGSMAAPSSARLNQLPTLVFSLTPLQVQCRLPS
jgi:hypothetical protein